MVEVLAIHEDQIARYGGTYGIRDAGALESALYRAQSGYYENIFQEAAALWESLAQNHPFLDGNKRTAFASVYTFLRINGHYIETDWETIYHFINGLYQTNSFEYKELLSWLESNVNHHGGEG